MTDYTEMFVNEVEPKVSEINKAIKVYNSMLAATIHHAMRVSVEEGHRIFRSHQAWWLKLENSELVRFNELGELAVHGQDFKSWYVPRTLVSFPSREATIDDLLGKLEGIAVIEPGIRDDIHDLQRIRDLI